MVTPLWIHLVGFEVRYDKNRNRLKSKMEDIIIVIYFENVYYL